MDISDILVPGGKPIGVAGSGSDVREVGGGAQAATDLFNQLSQGATAITAARYTGKMVQLPTGGTVGLRAASKSGPPTIDVNVPGIPFRKIKFL